MIDPQAPIELNKLPPRVKAAALHLMYPLERFSRMDLSTKFVHTLKTFPNCSRVTINALRKILLDVGLYFADEQPGRPVPRVNEVVTLHDRARKISGRSLQVRVVQTPQGIALQPLRPDGKQLCLLSLEYHEGKITATLSEDSGLSSVFSYIAEEVFHGRK